MRVNESTVEVFVEFNDIEKVERVFSYTGEYSLSIDELFNMIVTWIDEILMPFYPRIEAELSGFEVELTIEFDNNTTHTGTYDLDAYIFEYHFKEVDHDDMSINDLFDIILEEIRTKYGLSQSVPDLVKHQKSSPKHKHRTSTGLYVRSKSEAIVAETLTRLGLHFEYEKKLHNPMNSRDFRLPDFTIYHEGKTYYWEHLGMLSDEGYKHSWDAKKEWYVDCGFGKNLITSRDESDGSIDIYQIEMRVRARILS